MKTIILVYLSLLSTISVFAQIKVDSLGDAEMGQVIFTKKHSTNNLRTIELKSPRWDGGFVIDKSGYYSASTFRPNTDWYGMLGTSSKHWGVAYIDHIFTEMEVTVSDEAVKENIRQIENPVDKLRLLNGVRYDVKDSFYKYADIKVDSSYLGLNPEQSKIKQEDEAYKNKLREKSKNQIGFIAQELKEIFPELVYRMDDTSYYAINYIGLIPVLIEAFKEQQSLIEKQSEKIAQLEKSFDTINISKKSATVYDTLKESNTTSGAVLYQNSPNPFNQSTTIEYFISYEFDAAFIYIFDMNGSQISSKELDKTGGSSITLGSSELEPGMYLYTLVVDGFEINTKKMILTRN